MTVGLHPSQIDEADELLTNDPLALLIGMVLDRQVGQTRNKIVAVARKLRFTMSEDAARYALSPAITTSMARLMVSGVVGVVADAWASPRTRR